MTDTRPTQNPLATPVDVELVAADERSEAEDGLSADGLFERRSNTGEDGDPSVVAALLSSEPVTETAAKPLFDLTHQQQAALEGEDGDNGAAAEDAPVEDETPEAEPEAVDGARPVRTAAAASDAEAGAETGSEAGAQEVEAQADAEDDGTATSDSALSSDPAESVDGLALGEAFDAVGETGDGIGEGAAGGFGGVGGPVGARGGDGPSTGGRFGVVEGFGGATGGGSGGGGAGGGGGFSGPAAAAPRNDDAPVLTSARSAEVSEDAAGAVYTARATDPDPTGEPIRYSLIDDAGGLFEIDAATGAVTVADGRALDFETATEHEIAIRMSDGVNASTATVTLQVLDANDSAQTLTSATAATLAEDAGGVLYTATVDDADGTGEAIRFSLADDAGGLFRIDEVTGAVTLADGRTLDFETAAAHRIVVRSTDGTNSAEHAVELSVTDVAERIVLDDGGVAFSDAGAAEGGVSELSIAGGAGDDTIQAGDGADIVSGGAGNDRIDGGAGADRVDYAGALSDFSIAYEAGTQTFTITDGNAADGLDEGADTVQGVESFSFGGVELNLDALIFEAALQANAAPTDIQLVAAAPGAPVAAPALSEAAEAGDLVGRLSAFDAEGDPIRYTLTNADGEAITDPNFTIVGDELRVSATASFDFETAPDLTVYVTAADALETSDPQAITIDIADANDLGQSFVSPDAVQVAEGGAGALFTVEARDGDTTGEPIRYSLTDDAEGRFTIDEDTGVVSLADGATLDFEAQSSFSIDVASTDGANGGAQTVRIDLQDVAETIQLADGGVAFTDTDVTELSVTGGAGVDTITGGAGADRLNGSGDGDRLEGGAGDDVLTGGTAAFGQAGTVTVAQDSADQWHTISFDAVIPDAVVVLTANTLNDADPYTIRVRNVTDTGFEFQIDEWDYLDGVHAAETLSWMAVAEGVHTLSNGVVVEAGVVEASDSERVVDFTAGFEDAPLVFSQIESVNDPDAATTRQRSVTEDGFRLSLEGEESDPDHGTESVGFIAIEQAGALDGLFAGATRDEVTHNATTLSFQDAFTGGDAPVVLAAMQSLDGGDTATTSATGVSTTGVTVAIEEEQSRDSETNHTSETVGVLAIESGLLSGVSADTAVFQGAFEDFSIAYDPATRAFTVTDANTADGLDEGTDTVSGIGRFAFAGVDYDAEALEAVAVQRTDLGGGDVAVESGSRSDLIAGGDGDDRLTGGGGDDTLSGGAGSDTAVFTGARAQYDISFDADGRLTVADQTSGRDGTDVLTGVETLQFSDRTLGVQVDGAGASALGGTGATLVFGGAGDDTLTASGQGDLLVGGAGDDRIDGATGAIGQAGTVTVSQSGAAQWHSISFDAPIEDAVVVLTANTLNEPDPYTVRVRNVTDAGFEFQIDEWDYLDGVRGPETLSWVAIAEGTHVLGDGTVIEAGTASASSSEVSVSFSASFDDGPLVFSQIESVNDASAADTRQRTISADGFRLSLEGEERSASHGTESVGYIAIEAGTGLDGLFAGETGDRVNQNGTAVSFGDAFAGGDAPAVIADMQTLDGGDTSSTVATGVSSSGVTVAIDEEQSRDSETGHTTENVGVLAIETGLIQSGGADTVGYDGALGDFSVAYDGATGALSITDHNLADGLDEGSDTVTGVERFQFADEVVDLEALLERAAAALSTGDGGGALRTGDGAQTLLGGTGEDTLSGGAGNDLLVGGDGNDLFELDLASGSDVVDGGAGWTDQILLSGVDGGALDSTATTLSGNGWTVELTQGTIESVGSDHATLTADAAGRIRFTDSGDETSFSNIETLAWTS